MSQIEWLPCGLGLDGCGTIFLTSIFVLPTDRCLSTLSFFIQLSNFIFLLFFLESVV